MLLLQALLLMLLLQVHLVLVLVMLTNLHSERHILSAYLIHDSAARFQCNCCVRLASSPQRSERIVSDPHHLETSRTDC